MLMNQEQKSQPVESTLAETFTNNMGTQSSQQQQLSSPQNHALSKKTITKKSLKRSKKMQDENFIHALTQNPINEYQGQFKSPQNLTGYITGDSILNPTIKTFFATCIVLRKDIAIASAHQMPKKKEYNLYLKLPKNFQNKKYTFYNLQIDFDENQAYSKYQLSKDDFVFLKIKYLQEENDAEKDIEQRTKRLLFPDLSLYQDKFFSFQVGKNFGYIQDSIKLKDSYLRKQSLLFSKGTIYYNKEILEYNASTINGMSGGPIFIQLKGKLYLIGMHLYGNFDKQKNYGMLFTTQFYQKLNIFISQSNQSSKITFQQVKQLENYQFLEDKLNKIYKKDKNSQFQEIIKILKNLIREIKGT